MGLLSPTVDIWRRALRHFVWNPLSRAAWCILSMKGSLFSHMIGHLLCLFLLCLNNKGIDTDKVIIFRCLLKRYTSTSQTSTSLKLWLFGSQYQYQLFCLQHDFSSSFANWWFYTFREACGQCDSCWLFDMHPFFTPKFSAQWRWKIRNIQIFLKWMHRYGLCLGIATPNDCAVNCHWLCICDFRDVNLLFTFYNFKYAFKMFNKNNHYNIDPVLFTASC